VSSRSSLKQIQMLSATHGWMRAYPGELYSNAAEKWERVEVKLPERAYLTDIYFVSPDTGWVAASKTELDFDASKNKGSFRRQRDLFSEARPRLLDGVNV